LLQENLVLGGARRLLGVAMPALVDDRLVMRGRQGNERQIGGARQPRGAKDEQSRKPRDSDTTHPMILARTPQVSGRINQESLIGD
jgi:hypothetical protein